MKPCSSLSKRQLRRRVKQAVSAAINNFESIIPPAPPTSSNNYIHVSPTLSGESSHFNEFLFDQEIYDGVDPDIDNHQDFESSDYSNDSDDEQYQIREELREWSLVNNVTSKATTSLLKLLKKHSCFSALPADSRSLLSTRRNFVKRDVPPGTYVHFGLERGLLNYVKHVKIVPDLLSVLISVDGIPISDSSKSDYWPILASIYTDSHYKPFCVGIYQGCGKPNDQNEYLKDFVDECKQLLSTGVKVTNKLIPVKLKGLSVMLLQEHLLCARNITLVILRAQNAHKQE